MGAILDRLRMTDMVAVCNAYNATTYDLEKIGMIEDIIFPIIQKRFQQQNRGK